MKKILIYICIVVAILALIGLGIFYSIKTTNNSLDNVSVEENKEQENTGIITVNDSQNDDSTQENVRKDGKIVASNGFEFDEEDLKRKIGIYLIYENFMNDYFVPEQENENANIVDYANEAKVLIGYYLVMYKNLGLDLLPTEETVRKAVEEFCGEHYEDFIDTAEYWIAYDGDNAYEFVGVGDYNPSGYCNSIESIEEVDGKYIVTFIYSRPEESDYIDGNLEKVQKYRKQFSFIYHEDAIYTNYQLTELSFLKGEKITE